MAVNKVVYGGETVVDLTADTVKKWHLPSGITAHSADGEQITGIATKFDERVEYTPGTIDIHITETAGQPVYFGKGLSIKGDVNLSAENIRKDVTIFGVTGTYEGGASAAKVAITNSVSESDDVYICISIGGYELNPGVTMEMPISDGLPYYLPILLPDVGWMGIDLTLQQFKLRCKNFNIDAWETMEWEEQVLANYQEGDRHAFISAYAEGGWYNGATIDISLGDTL